MGQSCEETTLFKILGSPPINAVLHAADLNILRSLPASLRHYPPCTTVSKQGDWTNSIFIIGSGWSCMYRNLPDGDRQILDFPLKGDFLGFRTGFGFNYYTLFSLTEISIIEISLGAFIESLGKSPSLAMIFLELMARQRNILLEHLINLGRRTSLARIAHLLLELGYRTKANGTGDERWFYCPLTQIDLADALGLTPIHVNRMLRELREESLLLFRNNEVNFINKPALIQLCSFDENYLWANNITDIHMTPN